MIERMISPYLCHTLTIRKGVSSILLLGPRQTGKTTLISSLLQRTEIVHGKKVLTYNLKDLSYYRRIVKEPESLKQNVEFELETHKKLILFLDEIQLVPELLNDLQVLLDNYKNRLSVILTGSSARKLKRLGANSLPGRVINYSMEPLTLWELGVPPKRALIPWPSILIQSEAKPIFLERLLRFGSLPGIYVEEDKKALLSSYCDTYLKEEIIEESQIRKLSSFERFLEYASLRSGQPLTFSTLATEAGTSVDTIKKYYEVLHDTLVCHSFDVWIPSSTKRMLLAQKNLIFDTGVRNALMRTLDHEDREHLSKLFEDFVGLEIFRRIRNLKLPWVLRHYRTKDKAEIDWILEVSRKNVFPIEVKYSHSLGQGDFSTLRRLIKERGRQIGKCLLIYLGPTRKIEDKLYAVHWRDF